MFDVSLLFPRNNCRVARISFAGPDEYLKYLIHPLPFRHIFTGGAIFAQLFIFRRSIDCAALYPGGDIFRVIFSEFIKEDYV